MNPHLPALQVGDRVRVTDATSKPRSAVGRTAEIGARGILDTLAPGTGRWRLRDDNGYEVGYAMPEDLERDEPAEADAGATMPDAATHALGLTGTRQALADAHQLLDEVLLDHGDEISGSLRERIRKLLPPQRITLTRAITVEIPRGVGDYQLDLTGNNGGDILRRIDGGRVTDAGRWEIVR